MPIHPLLHRSIAALLFRPKQPKQPKQPKATQSNPTNPTKPSKQPSKQLSKPNNQVRPAYHTTYIHANP
ncbi:uncharacterized protein K452DRAFT_289126 [Aplosporella prunicola CBS 121167]|uniref:Uncharacterized protein n=1 Tax=Aplosporella prunicola CBS 121167 TaxID=1176127 RepID=A0A6A6B8V8_9PEZI|nr:uncharacterized protein K452DRAFT_289126 [Aplosporella prunicola CBS 121167]KAF2140386.1 hypothetical protein K452DRAFT_289126 [Aplosporella prunicola CBS 121167]